MLSQGFKDRLDRLQESGLIAGWQDSGGPNYGLGEAPLPAKLFPANGGPAYTIRSEYDAVGVLDMVEAVGFTPYGLPNQLGVKNY